MTLLGLARDIVGFLIAITGQWTVMQTLFAFDAPPFGVLLTGLAVFVLIMTLMVKW